MAQMTKPENLQNVQDKVKVEHLFHSLHIRVDSGAKGVLETVSQMAIYGERKPCQIETACGCRAIILVIWFCNLTRSHDAWGCLVLQETFEPNEALEIMAQKGVLFSME